MEEFIGLKIVAFLLWTAGAWYVGHKWTQFNSASDIAALYQNSVAKLNALKEKVVSEVKAAEDKAAELKKLLG